jgi:hypothetical protein
MEKVQQWQRVKEIVGTALGTGPSVRAIVALGKGDARMAVSRADAEKWPNSAFRFELLCDKSRIVGNSYLWDYFRVVRHP